MHGEQYIKLHKPFDADGAKLSTTTKVGDILDKGKHLAYSTDYESCDEDGELVCTNRFVTFVRYKGGSDGNNPVQNEGWKFINSTILFNKDQHSDRSFSASRWSVL